MIARRTPPTACTRRMTASLGWVRARRVRRQPTRPCSTSDATISTNPARSRPRSRKSAGERSNAGSRSDRYTSGQNSATRPGPGVLRKRSRRNASPNPPAASPARLRTCWVGVPRAGRLINGNVVSTTSSARNVRTRLKTVRRHADRADCRSAVDTSASSNRSPDGDRSSNVRGRGWAPAPSCHARTATSAIGASRRKASDGRSVTPPAGERTRSTAIEPRRRRTAGSPSGGSITGST